MNHRGDSPTVHLRSPLVYGCNSLVPEDAAAFPRKRRLFVLDYRLVIYILKG